MEHTLIISAMIFFLLNWLSSVISKIEHLFVQESLPTVETRIAWSLGLFKMARVVLFGLGSVECAQFPGFDRLCLGIGIVVLLAGSSLRVLAIRSLGPMWSYHARSLERQYRVTTGVYRYLRHPAYLGNLYLVGLLLLIGSKFSSLLALVFVLSFYVLRANVEEKLLAESEVN